MIGVSKYRDVASRPIETGAFLNSLVGTERFDTRNILVFRTLLGMLQPVLELDTSSVRPRFEIGSETYSLGSEVSNVEVPEDILEVDVAVVMGPRKRYSLPAVILSWKKAEPLLVDPDWIED